MIFTNLSNIQTLPDFARLNFQGTSFSNREVFRTFSGSPLQIQKITHVKPNDKTHTSIVINSST